MQIANRLNRIPPYCGFDLNLLGTKLIKQSPMGSDVIRAWESATRLNCDPANRQ